MYKINGSYYLMAAEGGTEYGHMITYARADSVWGEFKGYDKCPDKEVHHSKYKQHSKGNSQANLSYRSLAVIEKPSIEKQYNINQCIDNSGGQSLFPVFLYRFKKVAKTERMLVPCRISRYIGHTGRR